MINCIIFSEIVSDDGGYDGVYYVYEAAKDSSTPNQRASKNTEAITSLSNVYYGDDSEMHVETQKQHKTQNIENINVTQNIYYEA